MICLQVYFIKNCLVVGAVNYVYNYADPSNVEYNFYNYGPTDDGRIKPDVVAQGVQVYSTTSISVSYDSFNGTSMAPAITGLIMLLQEYYKNLNGVFYEGSCQRFNLPYSK
jgi:hypothetical protein